MLYRFSLFAAFISIVFLSSCSSKKNTVKSLKFEKHGVRFVKTNNIDDVLNLAAKEGKLVYLDIYTDWCLPCKVMTENVYSQESVIDYMNKNFISYKVNGEKQEGPMMVAMFELTSYPGIFFLNERGGVIEKNIGGLTADELIQMGDRALVSTSLSAL